MKKWLKKIKNEKHEESYNFSFFGKFLHHWKQKWWKMILKKEKNEKNDKEMIKNDLKKDTWNDKKMKMIK